MNKQPINLGKSFWLGISFTAGCFGFGWIPFVITFICLLITYKDE